MEGKDCKISFKVFNTPPRSLPRWGRFKTRRKVCFSHEQHGFSHTDLLWPCFFPALVFREPLRFTPSSPWCFQAWHYERIKPERNVWIHFSCVCSALSFNTCINRVFDYDCHVLTFPPNYNYLLKVRVPKEAADGTYMVHMCWIVLQAGKLTKTSNMLSI